MKETPLHFDPRSPQLRGKLWVRVENPDGSTAVRIFWRRLAARLALVALAGWILLTALIWGHLRFLRGHTTVSYLDLLFYPARAAHFRQELGRHYYTAGVLAMSEHKPREGYPLLLAALARIPGDLAVRRTVAIHEIRLGMPLRALRTLESGALYAGEDLDYLKLTFALLLESQQDDRAIDLATQLLPTSPDTTLLHRFVALQAATAHFHRGRYTAAEQLIAAWSLELSREGTLLQARCDRERGYAGLALLRLEKAVAQFPKPDDLHLELIALHRARREFAAAGRSALLRYLQDPASPGPRVSYLLSLHDNGDTDAVTREQAAYLRDFGTDPRALLLLAWHALDTLQPALMEQTLAAARVAQHPLLRLELAHVELLLNLENYAAAKDVASLALGETTEPDDPLPAHLRALRALAFIALGDAPAGELELRALRTTVQWRPADLLFLARHLRLLGLPALAREFLDQAVKFDHRNEKALAELVRLDALARQHDPLADHLPRLLQFAKPPRDILEEALLSLDPRRDADLRRAILTRLAQLPAPDHAL